MSVLDKLCSIIAIPIGAVFMVLGIFGLFAGAKATFTLPPILGALPFFLGWAMCITLIKYWIATNRMAQENQPYDEYFDGQQDH